MTVPPARTDLTGRRKLIAKVIFRGMDLYERLTSRLLARVTGPADDLFYRQPEDLDALRPGDVLDARPVEVRGFRRRMKADAWQVKFRSTDSNGAAVSGVTTVMIPRRRFNGPVRPLLSYQCAIDSLGATADPSYRSAQSSVSAAGSLTSTCSVSSHPRVRAWRRRRPT